MTMLLLLVGGGFCKGRTKKISGAKPSHVIGLRRTFATRVSRMRHKEMSKIAKKREDSHSIDPSLSFRFRFR